MRNRAVKDVATAVKMSRELDYQICFYDKFKIFAKRHRFDSFIRFQQALIEHMTTYYGNFFLTPFRSIEKAKHRYQQQKIGWTF